MTLDICLVRHAESEMNLRFNDVIGGQSNWAELTSNGILQSKKLGDRFLNEKKNFNAIYSSTAVRAKQTAKYCLEEMRLEHAYLELNSSLLELSQGDWEGKNREEIYNRSDVALALNEDNWNYVPGDVIKGESQKVVAERMNNWLDNVVKKHQNGSILAFTHGTAIKVLIAERFNKNKTNAYKLNIENTAINLIKYDKGQYNLIKLNDTYHLR